MRVWFIIAALVGGAVRVEFVINAKQRGRQEQELSNDAAIACGDFVEVGEIEAGEGEHYGNDEGTDSDGLFNKTALKVRGRCMCHKLGFIKICPHS